MSTAVKYRNGNRLRCRTPVRIEPPAAAGDGCWHGLRIPDAERSFEPCDLDECSFTRPVTLAPLATCGRDDSAAARVTLAAGPEGQAWAGHAVRRRACRSPVLVLRACGGLSAPAARSAGIVLCGGARKGAGAPGRPGAPGAEPAGQARCRGRATASSSPRRAWAAPRRKSAQPGRAAGPLGRWARAGVGSAAPARAGTHGRRLTGASIHGAGGGDDSSQPGPAGGGCPARERSSRPAWAASGTQSC